MFTVTLSYTFMFLYVSFSLGQYQVTSNNLWSLFISSKFLLGVAGIFFVALSVTSSIGLFAYGNMEATLIIFEVLPFLVLAVGVDNVFLFVQAYQRIGKTNAAPLEERISQICGEVIPSMILTSVSEAICFFLGESCLSDLLLHLLAAHFPLPVSRRTLAHAGGPHLLPVRRPGAGDQLRAAGHLLPGRVRGGREAGGGRSTGALLLDAAAARGGQPGELHVHPVQQVLRALPAEALLPDHGGKSRRPARIPFSCACSWAGSRRPSWWWTRSGWAWTRRWPCPRTRTCWRTSRTWTRT